MMCPVGPPLLESVVPHLAAAAERMCASPGTQICAAGEPADAMILVVDGTVDVLDPSTSAPAVIVRAGEVAGDLPAPSTSRTRTVRARTEVIYARIPAAALEELGPLDEAMASSVAPLLVQTLVRWHLFTSAASRLGLDDVAVRELEGQVEWLVLHRGEVLMREGESADSLFVLISGRLQVFRTKASGEIQPIAETAAGETIGEMAFFTGEPRSASVSAMRDSVVVRLPHTVFEQLIARRPAIVRHVTRVQMERIRRTNERVAAPPRITNVAVLPLGDGVPLQEFCSRLADALRPYGAVTHLTADAVDMLLHRTGVADAAEDSPQEPRLLGWLSEQETASRFVIYEAGLSRAGWVARSIREADCVLLVGRASDPPGLSDAERRWLADAGDRMSARRMLVLIHPDGSQLPANTHVWLASRAVTQHHHVRWDRAGDLGRVARFLAGRAVGIALGGGGARGIAHIGVLAALTQAGVAVDLIGGTSIGAAIAAQYAMGWSREKMIAENRRIWQTIRPHKDYTLPLMSIMDKRKGFECGNYVYGTNQIEDLWVPYFCVSSDLTAASMCVHRTGSLLEAATASASLPGVFVPSLLDGHLLVDGAVFNNLPGDVVRDLGCGELMVSRVSVETDQDFLYERLPTLGDVLRRYVTRWRPPIRYPSLAEVVLRASMLASISRENAVSRDADFLFQPPVEGFGLMEFMALERIEEVSYQYALERLEAWRLSGRLARVTASAATAALPH
jgi:predicted acylesterase/phospholipase RssA/CRP-like cAMP-binding protein